MLLRKSLYLFIYFILASCASLTKNPSNPVFIDAKQEDVIAVYRGIEYPIPATLYIKPEEKPQIIFKKRCYENQVYTVKTEFRTLATTLGNVFWLFIPGMIIDFATGSAWEVTSQKALMAPSLIHQPNCK